MATVRQTSADEAYGIALVMWCCESNIAARCERWKVDSPECAAVLPRAFMDAIYYTARGIAATFDLGRPREDRMDALLGITDSSPPSLRLWLHGLTPPQLAAVEAVLEYVMPCDGASIHLEQDRAAIVRVAT